MSARRRPHELVGNEAYEGALEVLSRMRHGWSLADAAAAVGIAPRTVRHYVGEVLEQNEDGAWVALPNDHLYRRMQFLDVQGRFAVEPATAREARKLSAYWHADHHYLTTGDARPLGRFRQQRLRTRQQTSLRFLTDLEALEQLGYAWELSFEDLYQH